MSVRAMRAGRDPAFTIEGEFTPIARAGATRVPPLPPARLRTDRDRTSRGVGTRILVVEDLGFMQEFTRSMLEAIGCDVDLAGDGAEAVAAVQEADYDVVLMDVQLPGMDGITATRLIRALDGAAKSVPIIGVTATASAAQLTAFRAAGMDDHVGKPFRREDLWDAVDRWAQPPSPPADDPARPPDFDEEIYGDVVAVLGPDKTALLASLLRSQLSGRFEALLTCDDLPALVAEAHAVTGSAAMLGFAHLSELCAKIEAAFRDGQDVRALVVVVREARSAALAALEAL